jgi:hypothetical protein
LSIPFAPHPLKPKSSGDYLYAYELCADEELRADGVGDDPLFADIHRQLTEAGVDFESPFSVEKAGSGLSDRMMYKIEESTAIVLTLCANAASINMAEAIFIKSFLAATLVHTSP